MKILFLLIAILSSSISSSGQERFDSIIFKAVDISYKSLRTEAPHLFDSLALMKVAIDSFDQGQNYIKFNVSYIMNDGDIDELPANKTYLVQVGLRRPLILITPDPMILNSFGCAIVSKLTPNSICYLKGWLLKNPDIRDGRVYRGGAYFLNERGTGELQFVSKNGTLYFPKFLIEKESGVLRPVQFDSNSWRQCMPRSQ